MKAKLACEMNCLEAMLWDINIYRIRYYDWKIARLKRKLVVKLKQQG